MRKLPDDKLKMCVKVLIGKFNFALEKCNQFCKQKDKFQSYRGSGTYDTLTIS